MRVSRGTCACVLLNCRLQEAVLQDIATVFTSRQACGTHDPLQVARLRHRPAAVRDLLNKCYGQWERVCDVARCATCFLYLCACAFVCPLCLCL